MNLKKEVLLHIINQPVPPPENAGGANRLVHWLATAQSRAGHRVYVAAPDGNETSAYEFIRLSKKFTSKELMEVLPHLLTAIEYHGGGDNSVQNLLDDIKVPVLRVMHGVCSRNGIGKNTVFLSRSHAHLHGEKVFIYNGIPVEDYHYKVDKLDYFLFLAKVKRSKKGVVDVIDLAITAKIKLIIAGGRRLGSPHTWFKWHPRIRPVGYVDGEYKRNLLSEARALIVPIKWDEPFGLTMVEAMASGTPVIAYNRGAVSEVIEHGVTGFVCEHKADMMRYLKECENIDPRKCRNRAETMFTDNVMAKGHIELLQKIRNGFSW
jgi:glycosyltransferase involved in cell wall biosynthesis